MTNESDVGEVVDEIVDDLDVNRLEDEAERLGLKSAELLERVITEARARLSGYTE